MGKGSDTDGDGGTLPTLACQGHRDNTGGGKRPPPPVRHADALEGSERAACYHCQVRQGVRTEETEAERRGDAGDRGEVLSGLW